MWPTTRPTIAAVPRVPLQVYTMCDFRVDHTKKINSTRSRDHFQFDRSAVCVCGVWIKSSHTRCRPTKTHITHITHMCDVLCSHLVLTRPSDRKNLHFLSRARVSYFVALARVKRDDEWTLLSYNRCIRNRRASHTLTACRVLANFMAVVLVHYELNR